MTYVTSAYIGQSGNSLGTEYDVQWERFQKEKQLFGFTDYKSGLFLNGVDGDAVLQDMENEIEGGANGDGKDANLLSWKSYVESNSQDNNLIFGSSDSKTFTNVNLNTENFNVMNEEGFSNMFGMDWVNGKPYDVFNMGQDCVDFHEFVFQGIGDDGQTTVSFPMKDFDNAWGNGSFTVSEVDTEYWKEGLDKTNPESIKAYQSLTEMIRNSSQWMTDADKTKLTEFEKGSSKYYEALYAIIEKHMDQGTTIKDYTG